MVIFSLYIGHIIKLGSLVSQKWSKMVGDVKVENACKSSFKTHWEYCLAKFICDINTLGKVAQSVKTLHL